MLLRGGLGFSEELLDWLDGTNDLDLVVGCVTDIEVEVEESARTKPRRASEASLRELEREDRREERRRRRELTRPREPPSSSSTTTRSPATVRRDLSDPEKALE